jgi:predicted ABC-type ATPase
LRPKELPNLFIISGCNGAGKTTASFTVLPELLNVKEFVNADEIARGLSPFQPDKVAIEAGKIMLNRLNDLLSQRQDFAFETTLSSKSFVRFIELAKQAGYSVNLIYYWLDSVNLAIERVKMRVSEGGHDIPEDIIVRRYRAGLKNLINLYKDKVDYWLLIDNSKTEPEIVAEGQGTKEYQIWNEQKWAMIQNLVSNDAH